MPHPDAETPPNSSGPEAHRARVLIVDDDERNAFAAIQALEGLGHDLVVARSGQEALRRLLEDEYAVILLDLHMPGMDGYETAELIRERKRNRNTPIVFLTAVFRDEAHLFQAYQAGAIDVVFKPVDPFILRSKVAVLVDLYLKTVEIQAQAAQRQQLLEENARVRQEKLKAERQLAQAQKMEAVGQLTGGVAHDFNNLLTVVLGNVDMLLRKAEKEPRRLRQLNAIRQAAERGRSLTRQLLAFSRRQQLSPITVDVSNLIQDFMPLMDQAVGKSIQVRFAPPPERLCVHVDPAQLESALLNLAVNARDAMPDGGSVSITCRREDLPRELRRRRTRVPAGQWIVIEVQDTGFGMSQDVLDRVFEPFFTTKEVGRGSGLGLSQVYGFVNQSGGHIEAESAPGAGALFRLFLKLSDEQAVVRSGSDTPAAAPQGRSERVLVVEDDAQVLSLTVEMLEELRYQVITAVDAASALDKLRSDLPIDVMFSDVVMPGGVNGIQLAREARAIRPELRILLTSGYVGIPEEVDAEFKVLNKPYDRAVLASKMRELCDSGDSLSGGGTTVESDSNALEAALGQG